MLLHGDVQTNEICSNSGAGGRCHALWNLQGQKMSPFLELRSSFPAMGPACIYLTYSNIYIYMFPAIKSIYI